MWLWQVENKECVSLKDMGSLRLSKDATAGWIMPLYFSEQVSKSAVMLYDSLAESGQDFKGTTVPLGCGTSPCTDSYSGLEKQIT